MTDPSRRTTITTSLNSGVLTLTLARPEKRNAINSQCLDELRTALDSAQLDAAVRSVVLTGQGALFCAGADIGEYQASTPEQLERFTVRANDVCSQIAELPKPVIAAVNGSAFGGGFELVLACDIAFASDAATFALPELTLGLIPGWAGTQRLTNALGAKRALESIWSGTRFSAQEAVALALVNRLCAPDETLPAAVDFARRFSSRPAAAVAAAKVAVRGAVVDQVEPGASLERALLHQLFGDTGREGVAAFVEKRVPNWDQA